MTFADDVRAFTTYTFKPQMRILGPKYGKKLGAIRGALQKVDGNTAKDELDEKGFMTLDLGDETLQLAPEELLIDMTQKEGFVEQADHGITVVLDTNLTPELLEEGFVREIISKVQTMRKEAGYEVTDHITLCETGNTKLKKIMQKAEDVIKGDVLADEICYDEEKGYSKDWKINGESVKLSVEKR